MPSHLLDDQPPSQPAPFVEDRKERIGRYVALIIMPFLMVTMMYATYMATMHAPAPSGLPVAVVGSGAGAEAAFEELKAAPGDVVSPRLVDSEREAVELLESQEIAGALAVPTGGNTEAGSVATVYVAGGGGASKSMTVQGLLTPVATQLGWVPQTEDVAPLPAGDLSGTVVLFAAMGMMLAGYVPLSALLMGTPHLLPLRRFLPLLAGWAVGTSSLIWLLLGPVIGGVEGHFLDFLGVGALAIAAVGLTQLLFTKVMGPMAVLLGMLLWVVFGMPASNLALPIESMPGFFGWLHGVLPLPAAGEALRSLLYFDGHGLGRHLLVLAIWAVAALVLSALKERRSGVQIMAGPLWENADTPLPAMAGGPIRSKRVRYFAVLAFPLSIVATVVGLMGFSMHSPEVRDMPVAVVGPTTQAAEQAAAAMQEGLGDVVTLEVASSVDDATTALEKQEIAGAYVLPGVDGAAEAVLHVASGAGMSQASTVTTIFSQVAASSGIALEKVDDAPLTEDDRQGSNSMYVGMSWIMCGFLFLAVMRGGAHDLRSLRQLAPFLLGWAVGMSVWLWFLYDVLIGAVNGSALEFIAFGALTILATSLVTGVFTRTLGLGAIVPVMIVLMLAGVAASGGGLSIYMVPDLFRWAQDVLPLPAAVDTARSLVYLDGTGVGRNVLVIAIWGLVGLILNLVVDKWVARQPVHYPPERYLPERG